jgi:hypothetical protein
MHYPWNEFSSTGYSATILLKDGTRPAANYAGLSALDVSSIKQSYGFTHPIIHVDNNNAHNNLASARFEADTTWNTSSNVSGYYMVDYAHASTGVTGDTADFWFYLPTASSRTVDARWTVASNRSDRAPYVMAGTSFRGAPGAFRRGGIASGSAATPPLGRTSSLTPFASGRRKVVQRMPAAVMARAMSNQSRRRNASPPSMLTSSMPGAGAARRDYRPVLGALPGGGGRP